MKNGMGKLYGHFTPEERFELVVEAMSRGDEDEVKRLSRSCPRRTYTTNELAYADRIAASSKITTMVCLHLAPRLAELRTLRTLGEALPHLIEVQAYEAEFAYREGYRAGYRAGEGRARKIAGKASGLSGAEPQGAASEVCVQEEPRRIMTSHAEEMTEMFLGHLEGIEHGIAADIRIFWGAFARFCKSELGVAPETLVRAWFAPLLPEIENLNESRDETSTYGEVDEPENWELVEECAAVLTETWRTLVREI